MRKPDVVIGENYLSRWFLFPKNRFCNIYLHRFTSSDDDRAMHDHPWISFSICLKGEMYELTKSGSKWIRATSIKRGSMNYRSANHTHRLVLKSGPAWTIFITGPKIREWGFHCEKGWKHWSKMTTEDGKTIGGCE